MKEYISAAGNTEVPAYLVLKAKGYQITVTSIKGSQEQTWSAENDRVCLRAEGPIELLGMVSMYEKRGSSWRASDEEIDDFVKRFCS
jgi:hypothetical protein